MNIDEARAELKKLEHERWLLEVSTDFMTREEKALYAKQCNRISELKNIVTTLETESRIH